MLKIIDGNIFESGADIIAHQTNCQGVMGSGVAKQVREKYPLVYHVYSKFCELCREDGKSPLGKCLLIPSDMASPDKQLVANLFGQENFGYDGKCYTDYDKLREAIRMLNDYAGLLSSTIGRTVTVAIPYLMGCHRGGGDWEIVSKMIEEELTDCDVTLYRYTGG